METKKLNGTEVRTIFGLKSANFSVELGESIKFTVLRIWPWSSDLVKQVAMHLQRQVYGYREILKHFYTGTEILMLE